MKSSSSYGHITKNMFTEAHLTSDCRLNSDCAPLQ